MDMMQRTLSIRSSNIGRIFIRAVNIMLVLAILISIYVQAHAVTQPRYSDERFTEFFEEDQDYDVLFFGSSHMIHSINAMQLWKDYGLTSYNWAGYATWTPASYWIFKNAIEYHKPKVAVLEIYGLTNTVESQDHSMLHYTFDAIPFSATKIEAVFDLFAEQTTREEMLFPFNVYHSQWNTLTSDKVNAAFKPIPPSISKGSALLTEIYKEAELIDFTYTSEFVPEKDVYKDGHTYIIKFIETCYKEGIQPVLLHVPYNVLSDSDQVSNLAEIYNVPYFDYYTVGNDVINYKTDLNDRAHLNFSGATQVTHLFGEDLSKIFSPEHDSTQIKKWDEYYQDYRDDLYKRLEKTQSIQELFLYLSDPMLRAKIHIHDEAELSEFADFLDRIEEKCEVVVTDTVSSVCVYVQDAESGEVIATKEF